MKKLALILFLSIFFLNACEFRSPLTTVHSIPIDQAVLGPWKIIPQGNDDDSAELRIYEFSDTEYSIHYSENGGDLYFRAYAIDVGGITSVQLELIGTDKESVRSNDDYDDRYHVAAYKMVGELLEIRTLNSDLINADLADSESLRKEFIKHKDNPELFNDPGKFKRIGD